MWNAVFVSAESVHNDTYCRGTKNSSQSNSSHGVFEPKWRIRASHDGEFEPIYHACLTSYFQCYFNFLSGVDHATPTKKKSYDNHLILVERRNNIRNEWMTDNNWTVYEYIDYVHIIHAHISWDFSVCYQFQISSIEFVFIYLCIVYA